MKAITSTVPLNLESATNVANLLTKAYKQYITSIPVMVNGEKRWVVTNRFDPRVFQ